MKKLFFIGGFLLLATNSISQRTLVERHQSTENGVTKGWTITKELDKDGNIVRYDSSYFENSDNSHSYEFDNGKNIEEYELDSIPGFNFRFYSTPGDLGNGFNIEFNDSLFSNGFYGRMFDFEKLMEDHRKLMEEQQKMMEEFFRNYPPTDAPNRNEKKPKGERI